MSPTDSPDVLNPAELRILEMLTAGETNKAIAGRLRMTEAAIKTAVHRIYRKLHVDGAGNSRVLAATFARERQIFPDSQAA